MNSSVSIVICTKNRLGMLQEAVASVRANGFQNFELLLIDQSTDGRTKPWAEKLALEDKRVRYVFNPALGVSRSRQLGVELSRSPLVLMTDDDCRAREDWVESAVRFFERHPEAFLLYGSVIPAEHDPSQGRVSGGAKKDQVFMGRWAKIREDGTAANMSLRKELIQKIGPFDPHLGLGAGCFGSEDWDLAYRTLAAGLPVHHSSGLVIVHRGFKVWEEALSTLRQYEIGTAAMFVKYWRSGDWVSPLVWLATFFMKWRLIARRVFQGPKFFSMPRVVYLLYVWALYSFWNLQGIWESFGYDVDKKTMVFHQKGFRTVDKSKETL